MTIAAAPISTPLSATQIRQARDVAAQTNRPAVDVMAEQTGLREDEVIQALGKMMALRVLTTADLGRAEPAFDRVAFDVAVQRQCAVVRDAGGQLLVAVADPFDADIDDWANAALGGESFAVALVGPNVLSAYFEAIRPAHTAGPFGTSKPIASRDGAARHTISLRTLANDDSVVVRTVNGLLYDAYQAHASDVHVESTAQGLTIRQRLDGVLIHVNDLPGSALAEQVISRIKVMTELDIAERRVPQDGRFQVSIQDRAVDFRVSIMPSVYGEDAVLRLLDKQALADELTGLRLDSLGFDDAMLHSVRRLIAEPYGMVLVTGPTGSGKTTTLYAAITEINNGQDKIITIEDPVEYQLPGVLQIPVNDKKGLTFSRGLRSILRHDPDKIMVGEIRDAETAQIAVQAALTGHLVLTTVHANNAFDVISRFLHMGVEPHSLVAALNGVVAQRLVRVNCPHCSTSIQPSATLLRESGVDPTAARDFLFRAGTGCAQCRGCGYRGRKAIAEILRLDDELRELIGSRQSMRQLKELAAAKGMHTLRHAALNLVRQGETTLEEINRVSFAT